MRETKPPPSSLRCTDTSHFFFFFLNDPAPTEFSPLPLPAPLPISPPFGLDPLPRELLPVGKRMARHGELHRPVLGERDRERVGRQSGRRAHDRAPQELGDAALRDAPYVSQRGGVRGEGDPTRTAGRSEGGRVGEEGRTRWAPDHLKKKRKNAYADRLRIAGKGGRCQQGARVTT